jgi:catechol 2,3-dioxygenase-like lactoylglutathione lyase family enzyme
VQPHHVGICVTDLERSLRFWCDGLGFESTRVLKAGTEWSGSLEMEGEVQFTAQFIEKGGFTFELLHYDIPGTIGQASSQRNQVGLTHLALYVDDLDEAIARLESFGGSVIPSSRTASNTADVKGELVVLAGPDGERIELIRHG